MSNILVVVGGDTRCSLVICVMIRGDFADIGRAIEQQPALCHGARLNLSLDHRSPQPTSASKRSIRRFVITEKAPTRALLGPSPG